MYDFCFTYPYALLLALGGVLGFAAKRSLPSLLGGLGSAAVLALCAQQSLNAYHQGKLCKWATAVSLLVSLLLSVVMGLRWHKTGKVMPAGVIFVISAAMTIFYIWNLQHFKEPLTKPAAAKA